VRHYLIKPSLTIFAIAIAFVAMFPCRAQVERKDPLKQEITERLHPKPVNGGLPAGIQLLAGYQNSSSIDFEGNQVGQISKNGGVRIKYEIGFSQGMAADPALKASYAWYREQKVGNKIVRFAKDKNVLIVSVSLSDDPRELHAANFYGTIKGSGDTADMLLMILPFVYR
jgi:hypothetical protein